MCAVTQVNDHVIWIKVDNEAPDGVYLSRSIHKVFAEHEVYNMLWDYSEASVSAFNACDFAQIAEAVGGYNDIRPKDAKTAIWCRSAADAALMKALSERVMTSTKVEIRSSTDIDALKDWVGCSN